MFKSVSNCCFQLPSENHNGQCRKTKSSLTKRTGAAPAKFLGAALTSSRSRLLYRYHLATLTFVCRFVWTHLCSPATNNRSASTGLAGFFSCWVPAIGFTSAALPPPAVHILSLHQHHIFPKSNVFKASKKNISFFFSDA